MSGGTFSVVAADGSVSEMEREAGGAYVRGPGAEHDVVNAGRARASFVEVEIKGGSPEP